MSSSDDDQRPRKLGGSGDHRTGEQGEQGSLASSWPLVSADLGDRVVWGIVVVVAVLLLGEAWPLNANDPGDVVRPSQRLGTCRCGLAVGASSGWIRDIQVDFTNRLTSRWQGLGAIIPGVAWIGDQGLHWVPGGRLWGGRSSCAGGTSSGFKSARSEFDRPGWSSRRANTVKPGCCSTGAMSRPYSQASVGTIVWVAMTTPPENRRPLAGQSLRGRIRYSSVLAAKNLPRAPARKASFGPCPGVRSRSLEGGSRGLGGAGTNGVGLVCTRLNPLRSCAAIFRQGRLAAPCTRSRASPASRGRG
jgi:hypothetical protein